MMEERTITDKVRTLRAEQQTRYAETLKRLSDASREWYSMLSDLGLEDEAKDYGAADCPCGECGRPWPEEC